MVIEGYYYGYGIDDVDCGNDDHDATYILMDIFSYTIRVSLLLS